MTYRIAHAAGTDAANRQMRAAGRTTWNQEDAALAAATLQKCFPPCVEHPEIEPELCGCIWCCPEDGPQQVLLIFGALVASKLTAETQLSRSFPALLHSS